MFVFFFAQRRNEQVVAITELCGNYSPDSYLDIVIIHIQSKILKSLISSIHSPLLIRQIDEGPYQMAIKINLLYSIFIYHCNPGPGLAYIPL